MSLPNINVLNPINGRQLKEDGTTANMADLLEAVQTATAAIQAASEAIQTKVEDKISTQLTGSKVEVASAQDTQVVGTTKPYNRAVGAVQMEVYCESGYIRVRTDGQPCTSTTGDPIAAGFAACWDTASVSIYYIQASIVTVVSR